MGGGGGVSTPGMHRGREVGDGKEDVDNNNNNNNNLNLHLMGAPAPMQRSRSNPTPRSESTSGRYGSAMQRHDHSQFMIRYEEVTLEGVIGEGSFGIVRVGQWRGMRVSGLPFFFSFSFVAYVVVFVPKNELTDPYPYARSP